jgi:murein DD-endopeptidase MepM/ murein hydrolase activator NlpD
VAAVLLLVVVAVVVTGADSAASMAPESGPSDPGRVGATGGGVATGAAAGSPRAGVAAGMPTGSPAAGAPAAGSRAAEPAAAPPADEAPRGSWAWPLQPRPPVLARFDPPDVRWGSGHRGVDLGAAVGQRVLAPTDGVVAFRGVVVDRGVLVLETAGGMRTTFEPVDSEVAVGTAVVRGQVVATVAATPGHCTPITCLHWGVLDGDRYLDPLAFVGAVRVVLLPLRPP